MSITFETQQDWLRYGMEQGWVGPPVCATHDGLPMTDEEDEAFLEHDPCISVVRLYESAEHRAAIEAAYAPYIWRRTI